MTSEDNLVFRLQRIYAAIGAAKESDLNKVPPQVLVSKKGFGIFQDFKGGLSDADLSNIVHLLIQNIASLTNHARRWLANGGRDESLVDNLVSSSIDLQLCIDIWNREKHGGRARGGGLSRKAPKIVNVNRVLRLQPKSEQGSSVVVRVTPRGGMQKAGSGEANVVVTADVVDEHGNKLGDVQHIAKRAVECWESFFQQQGLQLS